MSDSRTQYIARKLADQISSVLLGKSEQVNIAIAAFLAGGHCLVEDKPGVGKTVMARAFARAVSGSFRRIQFTSDLLPSDILGVQVYDSASGEFVFHKGPVFANIVLADEINRTNPRTQSALLEAMTEGAVTVENQSFQLPSPFFLIATQNPIELHGAYPLPESELDRFLVRIQLGYPEPSIEQDIIGQGGLSDKVDALVNPVVSPKEIITARAEIPAVKIADSLLKYVVDLGTALRTHPQLDFGVSTRGLIGLVKLSRVNALINGRDFCTPDDIRKFVSPVLVHRLRKRGGIGQGPNSGQELSALLDDVLARVPVPA